MSKDTKISSLCYSKRSKGGTQKRVVSVPIKDVERLRLKGDQISAPPSDSWAWRKYGQKPIKGSPYPRGYYKCSSSKGCPAKKQVERSKLDPNTLVVTYSCEHNHPNLPPASKNNHRRPAAAATTSNSTEEESDIEELEEEEEEVEEKKSINLIYSQTQEIVVDDNKLITNDICDQGPLINEGHDQFGYWLSDFGYTTTCGVLESPILTDIDQERINTDNEMAMIFTTIIEEDLIFSDLGELPECETVFRRGMVEREAEQRRLATSG